MPRRKNRDIVQIGLRVDRTFLRAIDEHRAKATRSGASMLSREGYIRRLVEGAIGETASIQGQRQYSR